MIYIHVHNHHFLFISKTKRYSYNLDDGARHVGTIVTIAGDGGVVREGFRE